MARPRADMDAAPRKMRASASVIGRRAKGRRTMPRYRFRGNAPQIPVSTYVADTASIIGRVTLGEDTSVWPGAVIRADSEPIVIGDRSNVQDCAVLHVDPGVPMRIGRGVTVGHQVMLHGCTIGDGTLVGIGAVVLNRAEIGEECLVAAGAIVTERKTFPPRSLIMGAPAKLVRELTAEDVAMLRAAADAYVKRRGFYLTELERLD
jgi:carbonic anhydrase/acetyltransferase-like protein (isoleucine patch superfamily)